MGIPEALLAHPCDEVVESVDTVCFVKENPTIDWVILTLGDRESELAAAVESVESSHTGDVVIVANTSVRIATPSTSSRVVMAGENLGVPRGRDVGLSVTSAEIVGFLDDDATLEKGLVESLAAAFAVSPEVGVVAFRVVDEKGVTARRHVPWRGHTGAAESRLAASFLGGACAIRREAYEAAGGYFTELMYGHEEVELAWRLIDSGWKIQYRADLVVHHPRTEISRHVDGWRLTGRNRVLIARRTLPATLGLCHSLVWLTVGLVRAPNGCRSGYLAGWLSGWKTPITRNPISWRTVWRLGKFGRFPIV